jgi:hypothetical protein
MSAVACVRKVLEQLLSGTFCLGALRQPLSEDTVDLGIRAATRDEHLAQRYVGRDGSVTAALYVEYRGHVMVQGAPPYSGLVDRGEEGSGNERQGDEETSDWATPEEPDRLSELRGILDTDSAEIDLYLFVTFFREWMSYLVDVWPVLVSKGYSDGLVAERWLSEDVKPNGFVLVRTGRGGDQIVGFLHPCFAPHNFSREPKPLELISPFGEHNPFLADTVHPNTLKPLQLSSGFHQVAPIVVQAGVMRRGELMCIENPEVHLHPALQTKVCEFLISEARCGKQILIETHSDLVVYRVLRAILDETLPQEKVRIYFTSLRPENVPDQIGREPGFPVVHLRAEGEVDLPAEREGPTWAQGLQITYSHLERIKIDERGRVSNWPPGFLDEDMIEFERLMQAMPSEEDEERQDEGKEG